eukprot:TRINITY_DN26442_c0_g2_i1.p1 TRINITY_DN26442_c0_g2~~TRINITY_DN26442_c0_g2_i1.p1  ORF type:complete len:168 (-),score=28.12 TRINITY_DN26442_c0_g2_i1:96-599(-)
MTSKIFPTAAAQGCKGDSLAAELNSFLPGNPCFPIKNGFIHYDVVVESQMRRCESCPADVALALKVPEMTPHQKAPQVATMSDQQAHNEGTCRPCAYFWAKEDGCRHGADCRFCHLCPPEEFKRRKKEKNQRMKEQWAAKKLTASSWAQVGAKHSSWSGSFPILASA